jgi:hypothetical protein
MTIILRLLLFSLLSFPLFAAENTIVLVAERASPALENLYKNLKKIAPSFNYRISTSTSPVDISPTSFVIQLGAKMPSYVDLSQHKKTIAVLVTKEQSQDLAVQSSIWIEPPLSRQLKLANLVIAGDEKIGLLVSNVESMEQQLQELSEAEQAMLKIVNLSEYENINQALYHVLKDTRLLLGNYDRNIYNAKNIKNILITSYRQQKVLVGPSRAYLKAGSFTTTFSDLDHIAKRIIDVIAQYNDSGEWMSADYNPYYRVLFNHQVARSLNIRLMDKAMIEQKMREK